MRPGSCSRQPLSPPVPSRSMQQSIAAALPIVLALMLLPPLAFASPPDPSWVAGFYDGADGDDVVSLVYETSAANAPGPSHVGLLHYLPGISPEGIVRSVPGNCFTPGPRAPPPLRSPQFAHVFNSLPPLCAVQGAPLTFPSIGKSRLSQRGNFPALRFPIALHPKAFRQAGAFLDLRMIGAFCDADVGQDGQQKDTSDAAESVTHELAEWPFDESCEPGTRELS